MAEAPVPASPALLHRAASPPGRPSTGVLGLRGKIAFFGSIGLAVLVLVVAVTIFDGIELARSLDTITQLHLAAETFRSVNNTLLGMESSQRGFLLTSDSAFLTAYTRSARGLAARMDSLHTVRLQFADHEDLFQTLDSLVAVRTTQMNAIQSAYQPGAATVALHELDRANRSGASDSLRQVLVRLTAVEEAQRLDARRVGRNAIRVLLIAEVAGSLFALVLLLIGLRRIFGELSAREHVEASLRSSERFLDSVIDLLPVMIFVKDARDLRYVRFNRTAESVVGRSRDEVLGRDDAAIFPRPLAEGMAMIDRAVLAGDTVRDIPEETVVAPNGASRTLHTRKVAIYDDEGRPAFLLGLSEDVTERRRAEQDILRARENAEAANRAKSDFLAKMSHELRTPLNSIIGFSQLLEEESFGPLNERQRRYVSNVLTSGRQLLDLINDVLDLSKVEAGRMELSLAHARLEPLLRDAMAMIEPQGQAAGLALHLEVASDLPPLLVDVQRVRQIVLNLLSNAIKFTPRGGSVTVRAGLSPSRSGAGSPMVRVSVIDTGVGIRPGDLERIFREFEQVDNDEERNAKGTGLGLALARRLAQLHGGQLWAESAFGLGSSFHLDLPWVGAAAPGATAGTGPLVLVVEDDARFAELMEHYLVDAGYRVAHVSNGVEVIERVSQWRPDAITMDVVLPGRDGLAVLRSLKDDPRTAVIPVLMVSVVDERVRGVALGAFDWLVKPVQRDALVATIQRAVAAATSGHPLVLVIDDDPGAIDIIGAILEGAGCRVVSTTDPARGLQLAATMAPAAVVLDLIMPEVSGFEVVTVLRQTPATRDVPIIIFSARELSHSEREDLGRHVLRILAKPGATELVEELKRVGVVGASAP